MAMCLRSGYQMVEHDVSVQQSKSDKENSLPQNDSISHSLGKKSSETFLFFPKKTTPEDSINRHGTSDVSSKKIDGSKCEIECSIDNNTSEMNNPRISTVVLNSKKRRSVRNCLHGNCCPEVPSSTSMTVSPCQQKAYDENNVYSKEIEPLIVSNNSMESDEHIGLRRVVHWTINVLKSSILWLRASGDDLIVISSQLLPRNRRKRSKKNNLESLTEPKVHCDIERSQTDAELSTDSDSTFDNRTCKTAKGMLSKKDDSINDIELNRFPQEMCSSTLSEQNEVGVVNDLVIKNSCSQRKRWGFDVLSEENINENAPTSKRRRKLDKHERLKKENEVVGSIDGRYEKEYEVECIIESRDFFVEGEGSIKKYLVKWADWNYCHCTWQTEADFDNSPNKFADYLVRESAYNAIETALQKVGGDAFNYKRKSYGDMMMCSTSNVWKMKLWEIDMNSKCENAGLAPIFVEDWYRVSSLIKVPDFKYLTSPVQSKGVLDLLQQDEIKQYRYSHPDFPEASFRCQCDADVCGSAAENCCPRRNEELITATYVNDKLIFLDDHDIYTNTTKKNKKAKNEHIGGCVIECSSACSCDISCPLRLIQRGRQVPLVIFYELGKGWGVRAAKNVKKGEFIAEYVGEKKGDKYDQVMLTSEAENGERMYQFNMCDEIPNSEESLVIDAKHMGNEARFFNHSCDPNMHAVNVYVDDYGPFYSRIALFALRDIEKGEELNFDYFVRIEGPRKGTKCLCGAKKCKKRLG